MPGAGDDLKRQRALAPRRRRARRWLALLGATLVLVASAAIIRPRLDGWVARALERSLARTLDGTLQLGRLELTLTRLELVIEQLVVTVPAPPAEPLRATAERLRLRLHPASLLGLSAGRVRLSRVEIEGLTLSSTREFWVARQRLAAPRPPPLDLRIDALSARDARVRYGDRETAVDLDSSELRVEAVWAEQRRSLAGRVSGSLSLTLPQLVHPTRLAGAAVFDWTRHDVTLRQVELRGAGVTFDGEAHLSWLDGAALVGRGSLHAVLAELAPHLDPRWSDIGGRLDAELTFEAGPNPLVLRGAVEAEDAHLGRLHARRARALLHYAERQLHLEQLVAETFDGEVRGTLDLRPDATREFRADLTAERLAAAELLAWLALPLPLASRLAGAELELAGRIDDPASFNGWGRAQLVPLVAGAGEGVPAAGGFEFELRDGELALRAPGLELAEARLALDARVALGARPRSGRVDLAGTTGNATATHAATLRLLDALGFDPPAIVRRPLAGNGPVRGTIVLGREARTELTLALANGAWGDEPFDALALDLGLTRARLDVRQLTLRRLSERVEGSLALDLAPFRVTAFEARAQALDPRRVAAILAFAADPPALALPTGRISGQLQASVPDGGSALAGRGRLSLAAGRWFGEPFAAIEADVVIEANEVRLPRIDVAAPAVEGRASGVFDLAGGTAALAVLEARVSLESLAPIRARGYPIAGSWVLQGGLRFGRQRVEGTLAVRGDSLRIAERDLGPLAGELLLEGETARWNLASADGQGWAVRGAIDLNDDDLPFDARIDLAEAAFDLGLGDPARASLVLGGAVQVRGELARERSLQVEGQLSRVEIQIGHERLTNVEAVSVRLAEPWLATGPIRFVGQNSDLELALRYDAAGERLEADARGRVDLGVLALVLPQVRASGPAAFELEVRGSPRAPVLRGAVEVERGRLRWIGFPEPAEDLAFRLRFDERTVKLEQLRARLGHGEVRGTGEGRMGPGGLEGFGVRLDLANVMAVYPAGFRGVYEGQLEITGDRDRATIGGRLSLVRGQYSEPFDLTRWVRGIATREYAADDVLLLPDNVYLDLDFVADGRAFVRNDLADVEASFDLHLGGSLRRPEVTGHLSVYEGGKIVFRDVEYRVVEGRMDFVDLERVNPHLSLRAETVVREYRVTLRVEGTLDKFEYELTSDPALPSQDIIALLTTGSTLEELRGTSDGGDTTATYLAGGLAAPLGNRLERRLGLERVSVNPLLVEGQADPTTRVTLGKRIARNLLVIFSRDLGETERQLYRIEWETNPTLRVSAERDTTGGLGGDVQYVDRFWWRKATPPGAVPDAAAPPAPAAVPQRVAAVRLEGVDEAERARLLGRLPVSAGGAFTRSRMFDGLELLRRHYVRSGRIEAAIDAAALPRADGIEVVYSVQPGPPVTVELNGIEERQRKDLLLLLEEFWSQSIFHQDVYDDAEERIRVFYQERGHYTADVQHYLQTTGQGVRQVRFEIDPGRVVHIAAVTISGAQAVDAGRIRRQMLTRPSTLLARRELDPRVLDEDVIAIRNLYHDLGHLGVRIAPPRVRLSAQADAAQVEIDIEEGPRITLGEIAFEGGAPFTTAELLGWSALAPGELFSPAKLLEAEGAVRRALDARGYPEARVRGQFAVRGALAEVRFALDLGAAKRIGAIAVTGNRLTRDRIVLREVDAGVGDPLSRESLLQIERRLYRLGIFSSVRASYGPLAASDPLLQRVEIAVVDSPPYATSLGGGYDTETGARATFSLEHRNLGGRDRLARLQGRFSGPEQRLQLVFQEPRLLSRAFPALLNLGWEQREEIGFDEERSSAAVRIDRRLGPRWSGFARYSFQRVDLSDVVDPLAVQEEKLENISLGDVGLTMVRDTRDDPILPTRGWQLSLGTRLFSAALLSDASFLKSTAGVSVLQPLPGRAELATGVRLGVALPFGPTQRVPLSERFFAGGDATLRGFARDTVGPKQNGVPSGGEALLLINEELRVPLWRQLKGVLFYDAGNVYDSDADIDPLDLRHVLGAGLRLETPIGPLRVEYGRKLDRQAGESAGELFLAIGNAF